MTLPTPYAPEPATARPVSIADLYAARLAELEADGAARHTRMAAGLARVRSLCDQALAEPVAAEPVAAEPVAAEPVAAEPVATGSWLRRAWQRLTAPTSAAPVTVLRYHGCQAGWRVVGIRANRTQAERLLSLAQRINPNATLKLR